MSRTIEIDPSETVPAVIAHWDQTPADQAQELAQQLWRVCSIRDGFTQRQENQLTADASILGSLACCKRVDAAQTLQDLASIWRMVKVGEGLNPGGLIHGEDSRHHRSATKFIEGLFLPRVLEAVEAAFQKLAAAAAAHTTPHARVAAYERACDALAEQCRDFDFETVDFDGYLDGKRDLFDQLADAEADPDRLEWATAYVYSVHRHLVKGDWQIAGESPLPPLKAERLARRLMADDRAMSAIEKYAARDMIKFGKGRVSTGTVAYRATRVLIEASLSPG